MPRVTVGMPVYNGEDFVGQAIESILGQDFGDLELVISDNGSTDATRDVCRSYASRDPRVRYFRGETNRGAAWNYNRCVELSTGEFFKWQSHDDICKPSMVRRCMETFDHATSNVVLVYPVAEVIDEQGTPLPQFLTESIEARDRAPHIRLGKVLRRLNMACAVFGVIRSSALRQTRLIGSFVAADYVLLAELALLGQIWEVPETLFQRRVHPRISTYANRSASDLQSWYDPSKPVYRHLLSPMMRLGQEYLRSIRRLPLSRIDQARCAATAARVWYARELRNSGGRIKQRIMALAQPAR